MTLGLSLLCFPSTKPTRPCSLSGPSAGTGSGQGVRASAEVAAGGPGGSLSSDSGAWASARLLGLLRGHGGQAASRPWEAWWLLRMSCPAGQSPVLMAGSDSGCVGETRRQRPGDRLPTVVPFPSAHSPRAFVTAGFSKPESPRVLKTPRRSGMGRREHRVEGHCFSFL